MARGMFILWLLLLPLLTDATAGPSCGFSPGVLPAWGQTAVPAQIQAGRAHLAQGDDHGQPARVRLASVAGFGFISLSRLAPAIRFDTINAFIHRWFAFATAMILFVRAGWRFRTEREFDDHRVAFAMYLVMLVLLGTAGAIGIGGTAGQLGGCVLAIGFGLLYTNRDLAEQRGVLYFWLGILGLTLLAGLGLGYWLWQELGAQHARVNLKWCEVLCCFLTCALPVRYLVRHLDISVSGFLGGLRADMIFSEGAFAEKIQPKAKFPSTLLLRHWRETGRAKKAWRLARRHLADDVEAFPIWVFAMETAAIHLRQPARALSLLRRLQKCLAIPSDLKDTALKLMQDWALAEGFAFDPHNFRDPAVPARQPKPLARILELRRKGRFDQAESLLLQWLEKEPDNAAFLTQLVRLCAQDLKDKQKAEKWITHAEEHLSWSHAEYLRHSLDEWLRLEPLASRPSRWGDPAPGKIVLQSVSANSPEDDEERGEDPLAAYLARVRDQHAASRSQSPVSRDQADELLAESRYGTAAEWLKKQLKKDPANFDLWLRYAEVHGRYCGNVQGAEKIIQQMDRSRRFTQEQMQSAYAQLREWLVRHSPGRPGA